MDSFPLSTRRSSSVPQSPRSLVKVLQDGKAKRHVEFDPKLPFLIIIRLVV